MQLKNKKNFPRTNQKCFQMQRQSRYRSKTQTWLFVPNNPHANQSLSHFGAQNMQEKSPGTVDKSTGWQRSQGVWPFALSCSLLIPLLLNLLVLFCLVFPALPLPKESVYFHFAFFKFINAPRWMEK